MPDHKVRPDGPEGQPDPVTPIAYMTAAEAAQLRTLFAGNPVIDHAEAELRAFGVKDGESTDAVKLLLTEREVRGVAARFVAEPGGLTAEQIEDDRIATGLDDADDHFVIGQTSAGWPGTDLMSAPVETLHFRTFAVALTACGIDANEVDVRCTEFRAEVTCSHCAGNLVDIQLAEPAPVANLPRTVSLEVINDELRALAKDALTDGARVATVLRGLPAVIVMDTDAEWARQLGERPLLILSRMLQAMEGWAREADAELVMPGADVLAALDGRPDAQLLTAPVWVLAMDIKAGMLLRSTDDDADGAETLELVTAERDCDDPECIHGATCIVLTVGGHEDPDVHFNGYSRVEVRIPCAVTR